MRLRDKLMVAGCLAAAMLNGCARSGGVDAVAFDPVERPAQFLGGDVSDPIWHTSQVPQPLSAVDLVSGTSRLISLAGSVPGMINRIVTVDVQGTNQVVAKMAEDGRLLVSSPEGARGEGTVRVVIETTDGASHTVGFPVSTMPMPRVTMTYVGKPGSNVFVAGSFNGWTPSRDRLADDDGDGTYEGTFPVAPGSYAYKFVVDGNWMLDPGNPEQLVEGGFANSKLTVRGDGAAAPQAPLHIAVLPANAPGVGAQGGFAVDLGHNARLEPSKVSLFVNNAPMDDAAFSVNPMSGIVSLEVPEGEWGPEQFVRLSVADSSGRQGTMTAPFDFASAPRSPRDEVIYYVVTDRFVNADPTNDRPVNDPDVAPIANFMGGDFAGIESKLDDGYFSRLGVTTLWLAPVQEQPEQAFRDALPPRRKFSGYHGYWPIEPEETNSRFGSVDQLRAVVASAHSEGIAVILDYVSNHVHEQHPWLREHPEWIVPLELPDGTKNIRRFDEHPFTTWFDEFLPSLDYANHPDLVEAASENALWWIDQTGADGFRHDAVKHVPLVFWKTLTAKINERYAQHGRRIFQIGETIDSRGKITEFIGPDMLDGQFDFPLLWTVRDAFAFEKQGLDALDQSLHASLDAYPPAAIMSPLIGNHDVARFLAYADGDVPDGGLGNKDDAFNKPPKVDHPTSDQKLRLAQSFLLTIPGAPMLYYGDEIGMTGHHDPDNRRMFIPEAQWGEREKSLFMHVSMWSNARMRSVALRRGTYQTLYSSPERLVYARIAPEEVVIVSLARKVGSERSVTVPLPASWGEPSTFEVLALDGLDERDAQLRDGGLVIRGGDYTAGAWRLTW